MSKFSNTASARNRAQVTHNLTGGTSYKISDPKKQLAGVVLAAMLDKDTSYQSDADRVDNIFELAKADPLFAAKTMVYARHEANLRSVSHVLANAVAESGVKNFSLRSALKQAIVRPDDMIEMFALWKSRHSGMAPNAMRRAFKDLLESNKWDAYQIKKYAREAQATKLRDIVLISHPKDSRGLLGKLIDGSLQAPKTVENMLSEGTKASSTFDELLRENRLGYMVAIKNIRNALETGISDEALDMWCKLVSNRNRVAKSRMLPYRFVDAWTAVKDLRIDHFKLEKVKEAINQALVHSAQNLDFVVDGDKVALILDESGSMGMDNAWKHAITLSAVLWHALPKGDAVVYRFSSSARKMDYGNKTPLDIIFSDSPQLGATHFDAPMRELIRTSTKVDKVIMFSDMQLYSRWSGGDSFDTYFNEYKRGINPRLKMLFWDLRGHGAGTPLALKKDILFAAGFSDKLLSVIPKMWKDEDALVREIEAIDI